MSDADYCLHGRNFPLVKTGGLADVAGSLPQRTQAHGIHTRSFVPGYPGVCARSATRPPSPRSKTCSANAPPLLRPGSGAGSLRARCAGPSMTGRRSLRGQAWPEYADNWKRLAAFSLVASQIARGARSNWRPHIIHAHDWHAAMSSSNLKYAGDDIIPRVLTVHNLASRAIPGPLLPELGLRRKPIRSTASNITAISGSSRAACRQPMRSRSSAPPMRGKSCLRPRMGLEGVMNSGMRMSWASSTA